MKTIVLGAGAMGSLYGGYQSKVSDVTLVDIWREHVDAVNSAGLRIEEKDNCAEIYHPRAVKEAAGTEKADLIIVFVKSTQTTEVLKKQKFNRKRHPAFDAAKRVRQRRGYAGVCR